MSELRWDPLKMSWVIITNERGRPPRDYFLDARRCRSPPAPSATAGRIKPLPKSSPSGPRPAPTRPGWKVRVIPHKYPALRIEGALDKRRIGLYDVMNGVGAHEAIIENPDHERSMADFEPGRNRRRPAGLPRPAARPAQRPPLPLYPVLKTTESKREPASPTPTPSSSPSPSPRRWRHRTRRLQGVFPPERALPDVRHPAQEEADAPDSSAGTRTFWSSRPTPPAFPLKFACVPKRHSHDFCPVERPGTGRLAETLQRHLHRLHILLHDPPYNFVLHNAPPMHLRLGKPGYWGSLPYDYHWHIELVPRLTKIAGSSGARALYSTPLPRRRPPVTCGMPTPRRFYEGAR